MEIAQLEGHTFLKAAVSNDDLLRSSAQNILDSYAHPWDLLAESLQNAVDAIELRASQDSICRKAIRIAFDCRTRSVEISDTGVGMSPEQVYEVITPNKSLKRGVSANLRGEKGVGLSFLVFACNHFKIETCDGEQTTSLEIRNANSWIQGSAFDQPSFSNVTIGPPQLYDGSSKYTRIWVSSVPERSDIGDDVFKYTKDRLVHVLRTRTAIGHTHPLFNHGERPQVDIEVYLKFVDSSGVISSEEKVEYSYASPDVYLKPQDVVGWEKYESLLRSLKHKSVGGKALVKSGRARSDGGREVKWFVFAASRKTFDQISKAKQLCSADENDVEGGIFISTKGMPTGVQISPPRSQQAAYWPSLFVLVEYDNIKWDVGRKFVGGRTLEMLRKVVLKDIFKGIVDHLSNFIAGGSPELAGMENQHQLDEIREKARRADDLEVDSIPYLKVPSEEQGVVALFHEMVGAGVLKGYKTYGNYGVNRYDSFVKTRPADGGREFDVFIEFKHEAASIFKEFEEKKRPRDIRLLVAWTANLKKFEDDGIEIEELEALDGAAQFHGATHKMILPGRYLYGGDNILHLMVLKDLVKLLRKS